MPANVGKILKQITKRTHTFDKNIIHSVSRTECLENYLGVVAQLLLGS